MKINCSDYTLYFIGFFLFLKNKILCNVRTKIVNETDVLLKVRTAYIPNSPSFVSLATSYFSSKRFSSNVRTNYFCTPLFEVRTDIHNKKTITISYTISRLVDFERNNWS